MNVCTTCGNQTDSEQLTLGDRKLFMCDNCAEKFYEILVKHIKAQNE